MTTVRMQVIQRFLLNKKEEIPEEPPVSQSQPLQIVSKVIKKSKFSPVLRNRSARNSEPKTFKNTRTSSLAFTNTSPIPLVRPVSPSKLSTVQSSKNLNKTKPLSNSMSLDLIKPSKSIIEKRFLQPKARPRSPIKAKEEVKEGKLFEAKILTKIELDKMWKKLISVSNGFETYPGPLSGYNVYVDKGNNSALIKKIMKSRPWWKLVDNKDSAHFVWCQWKDRKFIEQLKVSQAVIKKDYSTVMNWPLVNKTLLPKGKFAENEQFGLNLIGNSLSFNMIFPERSCADVQKLHNRLEFNNCLTNKKGLYLTMRTYCEAIEKNVFDYLPLTFHVKGEDDESFSDFLKYFDSSQPSVWIVKPGENTNRGNGINVCNSLETIRSLLKPSSNRTYIIQKYIENPLLINNRKFDIRCYAMITSINGVLQGYFYLDGYLRTASHEYNINQVDDLFIHLTNDAVQKNAAEYGKYENGNKLSYREFQRYLTENFGDISFYSKILPKIKEIVKETMVASFMEIDKNKRMHCMEIFGYDFMVDQEFKPWLIEVNTNPCLELASCYLRTLIPAMLENAFKIVVDSVFPPPAGQCQDFLVINRFELIFHQELEGKGLIECINSKYSDNIN